MFWKPTDRNVRRAADIEAEGQISGGNMAFGMPFILSLLRSVNASLSGL